MSSPQSTFSSGIVLADDLTGLVDALAPLGMAEPEAVLWGSTSSLRGTRCAGVNTNTRHAKPAVAAAAVREVLRHVREASWIYKKTDSTLRGNIGSELAALSGAFPGAPIYFAPAFPSAGRVVREGRLFVGGVPVEQTAFAKDPLSPSTQSKIPELLAPWFSEITWLSVEEMLDASRRVFPTGGLVGFDAETDDDVACALRLAVSQVRTGPLLLAGSGGMARFLPELMGLDKLMPLGPPPSPALVVSGSVTPCTLRQLRHIRGRGAQTFKVAEESRDSCEATARLAATALSEGRAVILASALDEKDRLPAEKTSPQVLLAVARQMARTVKKITDLTMPGTLALFGGETAATVLRALGLDRLKVVGEWFPGVGCLRAELGGRTLSILTKSGGFGPDNLMEEIGI